MKRLLLALILGAAGSTYATEPVNLLYNSRDAALAQVLAQPGVQLHADPAFADLLKPMSLLIVRDGLTDAGVSQLGSQRAELQRLTLAAFSENPPATPADVFNGVSDSQIVYLYFLKPNNQTQLLALSKLVEGWYTAEAKSRIAAQGYTPIPVQFEQQNRVVLDQAKAKYPGGYR